MNPLSNATLRQMLTIPYVLLVIVIAFVMGLLSYLAGQNAVNTLSNHLLNETVSRIAQAVDKHVAGSASVLDAAFPEGTAPRTVIDDDLQTLRQRFWVATSIHRDPNNYVYYGNTQGQFLGLYRYSDTKAELRLRTDDSTPRSLYKFEHINGSLREPSVESRIFDPRTRPWFAAGKASSGQVWTDVYIDFRTTQLVSTRAMRLNNATGQFEGVAATDMSLDALNVFLRSLSLTPNGIAIIVESDGNIVATSRGPHIQSGEFNNARLNAARSDDPLIKASYQSLLDLIDKKTTAAEPSTRSFESSDGNTVQTAHFRLQDNAGLDWNIVVAIPRDDFMHDVVQNVKSTAFMAITACALIALTGLLVLNIISRDLRQLASAAKALGDGIVEPRIPSSRKDEIGDLARSFADLQQRLLTDRLTGIPNREAVTRRIEDRIVQHRRQADQKAFAVLFIDLNNFKAVNDRFGHEVGDRVLMETADRLTNNLRADDLAARYGGDEFIVMLNDVSNRNDALNIRDKLELLLAKPLQSLDINPELSQAASTGAAIGVALYPDDGADLDTLIKQADKNMYSRKRI